MSEALSDQQLTDYARAAGFTGDQVAFAAATARAESGGRPDASNSTGNVPESSIDRGVLQFNSFWHPEVSDACAYDPACAFREAYRVSRQGTDFGAWVATSTDRFTGLLSHFRETLGPEVFASGAGGFGSAGAADGGTTPVGQPGGAGNPALQNLPDQIASGDITQGGTSPNFGNPFDGVAAAIAGLGDAITKPVRDVESNIGRALWTSAFVIGGVLMIGAGLLLYFRQPVEREARAAEGAAVKVA